VASIIALRLGAADGLRRLYLARDDDPAGRSAVETLASRAQKVGIEAVTLDPTLGSTTTSA
jgi:hypothetical protein